MRNGPALPPPSDSLPPYLLFFSSRSCREFFLRNWVCNPKPWPFLPKPQCPWSIDFFVGFSTSPPSGTVYSLTGSSVSPGKKIRNTLLFFPRCPLALPHISYPCGCPQVLLDSLLYSLSVSYISFLVSCPILLFGPPPEEWKWSEQRRGPPHFLPFPTEQCPPLPPFSPCCSFF